MKKFRIENDFWDLFPHAKFGILVCQAIDNTPKQDAFYKALLKDAMTKSADHLTHEEFSSNPVISVWREAFQKFKTKKGVRSSIEALLKRVHSGKGVGNINPLVDLYNAISLKYGLPCGGEDIETFVGDIRLTKATGDELFIPLGTDTSEPPYAGEIIYKDEAGAICRCWNWRESSRTMLTEQTSQAFMCIELVDESRVEVLEEALAELSDLITQHLGGHVMSYVLDINHHECVIEGRLS